MPPTAWAAAEQTELSAGAVQSVFHERCDQGGEDTLPEAEWPARRTSTLAGLSWPARQATARRADPLPRWRAACAGDVLEGRRDHCRGSRTRKTRGDQEAGGVGHRDHQAADGGRRAAEGRARKPCDVCDLPADGIGRRQPIIGNEPGDHRLFRRREELLEPLLPMPGPDTRSIRPHDRARAAEEATPPRAICRRGPWSSCGPSGRPVPLRPVQGVPWGTPAESIAVNADTTVEPVIA